MATTIRLYYDVVIAVGPMAVVAGFFAAVIAGDSSPFPIAAIVFALTGGVMFFCFRRNLRRRAHDG